MLRGVLLESIYNKLWNFGVRVVHLGKRLGAPGAFERVLEWVGLHIVPPPQEEVKVWLEPGLSIELPRRFRRARTYVTGTYEMEVTDLFRRLVGEGMSVVDVGAFCGYYAVLASRLVGASGRVYAFEPHPINFTYLERNTIANGLNNIIAINKAVSSRTGRALLALHAEADHHSLVSSRFSRNTIEVPLITLDHFFDQEGWPRVDVVKMDIEGGEYAALQGMRELSRRNLGMKLIMEFDLQSVRRAGVQPEDFAALLVDLGFVAGWIIERGFTPFSVSGDGLPHGGGTLDLLFSKG